MTVKQRQGWLLVATMFTSLLFVYGAWSGAAGVFFTPLLKYFGISHAKLSLLITTVALSGIVYSPVVGWLMDRVEARWIVTTGALLTIAGLLTYSQAHAFSTMVVATLIGSAGFFACTFVPTSTLISNWFDERRGLALGAAWAGLSLGGAVMAQIASYVILYAGWRWAYVAMAAPTLVLVLPMMLAFVKTHPPQELSDEGRRQEARALAGLEVREGLRTRSFWIIGAIMLFYYVSGTAVALHLVPYLIGLGYHPVDAAWVLSVMWVIAASSKPLAGELSDRLGPKLALSLILSSMAIGVLSLLRMSSEIMVVAFVVFYGLGVGSPIVMISMLVADAFGLKRYASLFGVLLIFQQLGMALGPVVAGRVFDVYGTYAPFFYVSAGLLVVAAIAPHACAAYQPAPATQPRIAGRGQLKAPNRSSAMKIVRFYATASGGSSFEEITPPIDRPHRDESDNVYYWAKAFPSARVRLVMLPAGLFQDWHAAPARQIAAVLAGQLEIGTTEREPHQCAPGEVFVTDDLSGRGHTTKIVNGPAYVMFVQLPESFDFERWSS